MITGKRAMDYSLIMLMIVIIVMPVLYMRMTTKVEETKQKIGNDQAILLTAPYDKEDIINYIQKSAEQALPEILPEAQNSITDCQDPIKKITQIFNKHLDKYIDAYNKQSYTKLEKNNYELYLDNEGIHAIAINSLKKTLTIQGTELNQIGTIWFAPSFTIKSTPQYNQLLGTITAKIQECKTNQNIT